MNELQKVLQDTEKSIFDYGSSTERMRLQSILQIEKEISKLEKRKLLLENGYDDPNVWEGV